MLDAHKKPQLSREKIFGHRQCCFPADSLNKHSATIYEYTYILEFFQEYTQSYLGARVYIIYYSHWYIHCWGYIHAYSNSRKSFFLCFAKKGEKATRPPLPPSACTLWRLRSPESPSPARIVHPNKLLSDLPMCQIASIVNTTPLLVLPHMRATIFSFPGARATIIIIYTNRQNEYFCLLYTFK